MLRSLVQGLSCLQMHSTGLAQSVALREVVPASRALPQPLLQHVRTTYVLKRKDRVHLGKAHHKVGGRKLKARDFVYELVEDTNTKKKEPIKVILKTSVEGLGSRGDVVEVKPHQARKELLLPGLAVYASPENLEKYSSLMNDTSQDDQSSSPYALSTVKLLSRMMLDVNMNKDKPWVIEPWHIRVAFRKTGVVVPEEAITMPPNPITGPDFALQNKDFAVTVKINKKEEASVLCRINHYTPNPLDRLPSQGPFWELPVDPLFVEQTALLEELHKLNRPTQPEEENV